MGCRETADINTFIWGVANCGASICVGCDTEVWPRYYHPLELSLIASDKLFVSHFCWIFAGGVGSFALHIIA
ncbi:hypothetical protein B296_00000796 [Ensete ventricosum]|uniref:Uncharacterized protein n=1 Tax=Ensete ventricosum TaxID=4639 RepID=A0A426ZWS8_ENSVE|nr:hypothetical protein B296_00000796 [Ensete ventricosum]